jgi:hypothetical protein
VRNQSTHITSCDPNPAYDARMSSYRNGNRVGNMVCKPDLESTLYLYDVRVTVLGKVSARTTPASGG